MEEENLVVATVTPRGAFLPFAVPLIGDAEIEEVVDSLRSGWVTTGPKVKRFEAAVAEAVEASHAVAVSSCTAGLHLSLRALGVAEGDEVIVPAMTFCSTANVVEHVGATPVLVDVDNSGNINVAAMAAAITERTRAVVPVHFAGQAVELNDVYRLAVENDLAVVEDAAHAIGSTYKDLPIGADAMSADYRTLRRTVVFSFYATKNMTTGEGGMVVTADENLAEEVRQLTLHGMSRNAWERYTEVGTWYYEVVDAGFKANMTDIQAAIGIHQLARLDQFTEIRQRYADQYDTALMDLHSIATPVRLAGRNHAFHLYVINVDSRRSPLSRAELIDALRHYNIGTSVHFIPIHHHPHYRKKYDLSDDSCPNATRLFEGSVSLPLYPKMTAADVDYVACVLSHLLGSTDHPGSAEVEVAARPG